MTQAEWITAGIGGIAALIVMYLPCRVRLTAVAGEGAQRSVTEEEYYGERLIFCGAAVGKAMLFGIVLVGPIVAMGPSIFAGAAADFSFRGYFLGVFLIAGPASGVARKAFEEMGGFTSTSDLAWAKEQVSSSNRAILTAALIAAVVYTGLVLLVMLAIGVTWWVFLIILVAAILGSLMAFLGITN